MRAANDLTNDLLNANAENLRDANREVREEIGARRVRYRGRQEGQRDADCHH